MFSKLGWEKVALSTLSHSFPLQRPSRLLPCRERAQRSAPAFRARADGMSERGVFAVDRGLFEHERFADEPFSEREAWIWMIGEAAYRAHRRRVGARSVELARGQFAHSLRFMAAKWQWSEARVRRFLKRLQGQSQKTDAKTDAMIDTASDAGITVITIRNYDVYQRVALPPDAAGDAAPTQQRRRVESREGKKRVIDGSSPARAGAQTPAQKPPSVISAEAHAFAAELANIAGHDPQFLPPRWLAAGPAARVQLMLDAGWRIETMREAARAAIRRKRDGPPVTIRYFETIFAHAHSPQAPLPRAPLPKPPTTMETADEATATPARPRWLRPARGQGLAAFALARARAAGSG
jgi:hypothetical protein